MAPAADQLAEWYRALDLAPGAAPAEIKRAWRDLARVWHPDRFVDDERLRASAEETLKRVNEAYRELSRAAAAAPTTGGAGATAGDSPAAAEAVPEINPRDVLAEGPRAWNLWRKKYADIAPRLVGLRPKNRAFEGIDFRECDLRRADLEGTDLYKADLSGALLSGARLAGADLSRCLARRTKFDGADLSRADLSGADLRRSDFRGARLHETRFVGADLDGADLSTALGITRESLRVAVVGPATRLPRA